MSIIEDAGTKETTMQLLASIASSLGEIAGTLDGLSDGISRLNDQIDEITGSFRVGGQEHGHDVNYIRTCDIDR